MEKSMKVAIHREGWRTKTGQVCRKWSEYWVFVGMNPLGYRGGRCGIVVDGKRVAGRFSNPKEALAFAQRLADANGYQLI